jgi:5-methylcytosine-specific restriction protein B
MNIEQLQSFFKEVYEEPQDEYIQCLFYPVLEALVNEASVNDDGSMDRDKIISYINKKYNFKDDDWKRKGLAFDHLFSQRFGKGKEKDFLNELVEHDGVNAGDKKTKYKLKDIELIRKFVDSGFCRTESIKEQMDNRIRYLRQNKILSDDELRNIAISSAMKVKKNTDWVADLSKQIKKYSSPEVDLTDTDNLFELFNSGAVCATGQANSTPIQNALNDEEFRKLFSEKINNLKAKDHKYLEDYKKLYDELIEELRQRCGKQPKLKLSRALCALFPENVSVIGNLATLKHLHDSIFDDKSEHPVEMHSKVFDKLNTLLGQIDERNTQDFVERMILPWQIQADLVGYEENHPTIWRISHGGNNDFSDEKHNWLLENNYVATNFTPEESHHQILDTIEPNHYFYLVRKARIILLGQFENELSKEIEGMPGRCRKFKPVEMLNTPYPVKRLLDREHLKLGGMPSDNSTVAEVKSKNLKYFESDVLKPVFNLSLENLIITTSSDENSGDRKQSTGNKMNSLNQILYGPPGTGKTYNTINKAIEIANPNFDLTLPRKKIKIEFDRLRKEGQIVFTTFHQSMSYEDFIEGIKPLNPKIGDSFVTYDVTKGIFKEICDNARSNFKNAKNKNRISFEAAFDKLIEEYEVDPEIKFQLKTENKEFTLIGFTSTSIQFKKASGGTSHTLSINTLRDLYYGEKDINRGLGIYYQSILNKLSSYNLNESFDTQEKAFVLIIDEINRGNVSQIFGELITLIEDDKRLDKEEQLSVILPYSKEPFNVPSNLYIIGTMNTADRSVEALDAALRRRFSFEEMQPDSNLIKDKGKLKDGLLKLADDEINLPNLLKVINLRIEKLLDKDHQIGHSYFINVEKLDELKLAFQNKIIPLLQEYFFGDYGKIGLVLGKGFVEKVPNKSSFADFPDADTNDFSERPVFTIKTPTSNNEFVVAIKSLLNQYTDGE